ncbi:MAG TPA: hypothetical protein VFH06_05795 [Candidatus Saccharimonadales bacterium]|nr:hypothetical protein [Candidatus Saccharimonadales bacterium]
MTHHKKPALKSLDERIINFFKNTYLPLARVALFIVFFWFGFIKLTGLSPAGPLAEALTVRTVGPELFGPLFTTLAFIECLIGILFLIPKAVRVVIPLLLLHIIIVCGPLVLVPELTWQAPFIPTLEGQYIIKNVAIVALAFGVAANTSPLAIHKGEK